MILTFVAFCISGIFAMLWVIAQCQIETYRNNLPNDDVESEVIRRRRWLVKYGRTQSLADNQADFEEMLTK